MAIRNPLTQEITTINERIKNRQDIGNLVNDELFGLLKNETQRRIIVDTGFNQGFQDIRTNITGMNTRLNEINTNLLPALNTNISANELLLLNRDIETNTQTQTAITNNANVTAINRDITTTTTDRNNFNVYTRTTARLTANVQHQAVIHEINNINTRLGGRITDDERKGFESKKQTEVSKEQQIRQDITKDVERELQIINERLAELVTQKNQAIQEITTNQKSIRQIAKQALEEELTKQKAEKTKLQTELDILRNNNQNLITLRQAELTYIRDQISRFNTTTQILPSQNVNLRQNIANPIALDGQFFNAGQTPIFREYEICDTTTGEPLTRNDGALSVNLVGGQTVSVRGVSIVRNPQTQEPELRINNLQITPTENIQFPTVLQLAVRARIQETNTTTFLDHYKTLDINIDSGQLGGARRTAGGAIEEIDPTTGQPYPRVQAYNNINQNDSLDQRIAAEYEDTNRTNIENEVIWKILRTGGNETEINEIYNDERKRNLLIQRIRAIPNLIPIVNMADIQQQFRYDITRQDNTTIPAESLINIDTFTDYIRSNFAEKLKTFAGSQIERAINTSPNRNAIIRTMIDFQAEVKNNKLDNNDHMRLNQRIPNTRPEEHPNSLWQRLTRRNSNKNNWTKFLDGRESTSFEDKIETNEGEQSFDLKVAVHGVNKIVTTINIKGEDEPIILDTRDVNEMTHMILGLEATKSGEPINRKLRCRMALNAVKAVVTMSPVTLHRQYQGNVIATDGQQYQIDRLSAHVRGGNLVLRGSCANSHNNRQRINHVVFDEQRYKGLHNIDELERGMMGLSNQINDIMNAMGNEFRDATSRIKAAPLMKYNTLSYLRGGPIKRLRARMVYGKTNRKFDFDTTASSGSKTVNIKFEKGKFTLSGTFKDKPFEFKGRSLGSLLRKKVDRLRVFDGVELPIFEKINESMVEKLRTNNLVGPENFAVADLNQNKTGRVFMLDSHGDLSYIEIEDRNFNPLRNGRTYGRIDSNNLPPQRIRCNETERREFMQNPLLSGRLIRGMRRRLQLI